MAFTNRSVATQRYIAALEAYADQLRMIEPSRRRNGDGSDNGIHQMLCKTLWDAERELSPEELLLCFGKGCSLLTSLGIHPRAKDKEMVLRHYLMLYLGTYSAEFHLELGTLLACTKRQWLKSLEWYWWYYSKTSNIINIWAAHSFVHKTSDGKGEELSAETLLEKTNTILARLSIPLIEETDEYYQCMAKELQRIKGRTPRP